MSLVTLHFAQLCAARAYVMQKWAPDKMTRHGLECASSCVHHHDTLITSDTQCTKQYPLSRCFCESMSPAFVWRTAGHPTSVYIGSMNCTIDKRAQEVETGNSLP